MNYTISNPGNTKPFNTRPSTDAIIVHHAAAKSCTVADIIRWHLARGFNGAGYNFFVAKNGEIFQLRPIYATGAHTLGGWNSRSIGICAEGNYEEETAMPDVQKKSIAECIDYCNDWAGKILPVSKHSQKWATACPGKFYPFDEIVKLSKAFGKMPVIVQEPKKDRDYLQIGDINADVGQVEKRLKTLGYYSGALDNKFGPILLAAVKKFQTTHDLEDDGLVGPLTLTVLAKTPVISCPKKGIVTATTLNVRKGPGTNYADIGDLLKGKEVKINRQSGKWFNIFFGSNGGWVSAEYIKC